MAARSNKLLYLQGYSERLADPLYALADLFLMPSSFEPCGISQMLAMRASLPCVVHSVGGLKDTVADGVTGFGFTGENLDEQAEAFVTTTLNAIALRKEKPGRFQRICDAAGAQRFEWSASARQTVSKLYGYANA
jgi:starch synthase